MKEIDLHLMNFEEALNFFKKKYNEFYRNGYRGEIKIIHGYGSTTLASGGVIKNKFREYCQKNRDKFRTRLDLNPGVTYVLPMDLLEISKSNTYFKRKGENKKKILHFH